MFVDTTDDGISAMAVLWDLILGGIYFMIAKCSYFVETPGISEAVLTMMEGGLMLNSAAICYTWRHED